MSTGHCSTHAPQVVQDHSTSGSMTPFSSAVPISGRSASARAAAGTPASCSAVAFSLPSMSLPPPASRYGALACAWSRSDMMRSFGESGLPVFQAGHCDWQRPHSVHVEKSRMPFQENCSTCETPKLSSSPGSSKSISLPPLVIGWSAPSAVAPSALRLNQMFGKPRKRCHATPMLVFRETTIIQISEVPILIIAVK